MNKEKIFLGKIKSYRTKKNNPISIKTCEPNLGKRGLYHLVGTPTNQTLETREANILDFLQYSDVSNKIKQIIKLINLNFKKTK